MNASPTKCSVLYLLQALVHAVLLTSAFMLGGPAAAENQHDSTQLVDRDVHMTGLTLGGTVQTIAVAPNGDIYAGGNFKNGAGNASIDFIALWNGRTWQPLGKGLAAVSSRGDEGVYAIAFDGAKMYVGGKFDTTGDGVPLNNFARWDTNTKTWEPLLYPCSIGTCGPGMKTGYVNALAKPLSGTGVFVGGNFDPPFLTPSSTKRVALYDGSNWNALSGGIISGTVSALHVDPLNGNLYAGGEYLYTPSQFLDTTILRWDGSAWHDIQNAPRYGSVYAITGINNDIYIGGYFSIPVGFTGTGDVIYAYNLAKWDGADWSRLGTVTPIGGNFPDVWALEISGSNVYVGGRFTDPRVGKLSHKFALWNGTSWQDTGAYLAPNGGAVNTITASGNQVYIGGSFSNAGGVSDADYIARYNGTSWRALVNPTPTPLPHPSVPIVRALGASGRKGTSIALRYRVWYSGPSTSEAILVFKNGRIVRRLRSRFAPRRPTVIYYLPLNTVGLQRGGYRYCVQSTDNYARKSKSSCAPLIIR